LGALGGVTPCEHGGEGHLGGGIGVDAQVVFRVQFLKRLEVSQEIRQVLRPGIGNSGLLFTVFKPSLDGLHGAAAFHKKDVHIQIGCQLPGFLPPFR